MSGQTDDNTTTARRIIRDPNFTRVVADNAFVTYLGDDFELALLAYSQDLMEWGEDPDGGAPLKMDVTHAEVARVRLSLRAAKSLAMNLLRALVAFNGLTVEELDQEIVELKDQMAATQQHDTAPEPGDDARD